MQHDDDEVLVGYVRTLHEQVNNLSDRVTDLSYRIDARLDALEQRAIAPPAPKNWRQWLRRDIRENPVLAAKIAIALGTLIFGTLGIKPDIALPVRDAIVEILGD